MQLQAAKMDMALGWQVRQLEFQKKQLEVHNMQQDALLERQDRQQAAQLERQLAKQKAVLEGRMKMIEQYAKLPKDSILMIAMADNPQLAAAYAASVHAENQEAKFQMQEKFRDELAKAYKGNNAAVRPAPARGGPAMGPLPGSPSKSATVTSAAGHQRGRAQARPTGPRRSWAGPPAARRPGCNTSNCKRHRRP